MEPTLTAGEFVLVDERRIPSVGDVVVVRHPNDDDLLVIKRLIERGPGAQLMLSSDNPAAGTDSRAWGPVDAVRLVGVVTLVLDRIVGGDLGPSVPAGGGDGGDR